MVFRICSAVERARPALVALALLAGCSAMHPDIALKREDAVAIVVSNDVGWPGPPAPGRVRVLNESTSASSTEVRTGAGAGAVAGAAVGFLCGPLAPVCVPMLALHGAQVGALGGAVVGSAAALPRETAERLRERVEHALQSQDLHGLIGSDVAERMRGRWNIESDKPTTTVEIRLQEFALSSSRDQRVRCSLKVNVVIREQLMQQPEPDRPTWLGNHPRLYEYVCPYEDLAKWLDESQGLVEANLAAASRYLAAEIVSGLAGTK
jgi:hypothetical protein